jgi:hypothetical protein
VAWLSFGSACSSGSTNKCPPGDKARVCDMASEAYRLTLPARHQFHRGGLNSRRNLVKMRSNAERAGHLAIRATVAT